jgi:hypothetical protein
VGLGVVELEGTGPCLSLLGSKHPTPLSGKLHLNTVPRRCAHTFKIGSRLAREEASVFLPAAPPPRSLEVLMNILLLQRPSCSLGHSPAFLRSLIILTICPLFGTSEKSLLQTGPGAMGHMLMTYSNPPDSYLIPLHRPLQRVFKKSFLKALDRPFVVC